MANNNVVESTGGLNEVLHSIKETTKTMYRDSDNQVYSSVKMATLTKWAGIVADALAKPDAYEQVMDDLKASKLQLDELISAAGAFEERYSELQKKYEAAQDKANQLKIKNEKLISEHQLALEKTKLELTDAELSLAASNKMLRELEAIAKKPGAKFDPVEASENANDIRAMRHDIHELTDMVARMKVEKTTLNGTIDKLHKEVAAAQAEASTHKAIRARHVAVVKSKEHNIIEAFATGDVDRERLEQAFGRFAVQKLWRVLNKDPGDPKGRLAGLRQFFDKLVNSSHKYYGVYAGLVRHALESFANTSSAWVKVVAPWVNNLVKDIVFLDLKPVGFYKTDLAQRIKYISYVPPKDPGGKYTPPVEKPEERPSWAERFASLKARVTARGSYFDGYLKPAFAAAGFTIAAAYTSIKGFGKSTRKAVKRAFYGSVRATKRGLKRTGAFLKAVGAIFVTVWDASQCMIVPDKVTVTVSDYEGEQTGKPITLFDADLESVDLGSDVDKEVD